MNPTNYQPSAVPTAGRTARHNRILLTIALFKFFKAAAMIAAGILALTYEHADLTKIAMHWVNKFRLDPDNVYVDWVLDHARLIHAQQLGIVAVGAFVYAVLFLVEGIGLYREKAWGEYLVIVEVCLLMPVESFGIYEKPDILRIGLLIANIFILVYLLYLRIKTIRRKRREKMVPAA
ncbi:MAG: DUF2127 domain-containing protein [Phycisphaerae bacterium]